MSIDKLKQNLDLCILKTTDPNRSVSIAYSMSGKEYVAGRVGSDTKLLDIPSEQAALILSVQNQDYRVNKILTLAENANEGFFVSPLVLKIIIDHGVRTGTAIEYTVIDLNENVLFHFDDVSQAMPFYKPALGQLSKTKGESAVGPNKIILNSNSENDHIRLLKEYASWGIERSFPAYDSASGYGTAVIAKDNTLYFSGQYSGAGSSSVHSEMSAVISALMDSNTEITHLGVVSTKFADAPCDMCGCCRQFLSEIMDRFKLDIEIYCFAKDTDEYRKYKISEYLPGQWTSKKW